MSLLSLLGVYANAEKVLLTHAPSQKRAQSGDVLAAMKAKEAEAARAAPDAPGRAARVQAPQGNATLVNLQKGVKCVDFRGEVTCIDGKWKVYCKAYKEQISYANLSKHCKQEHADKDGNTDGNGSTNGKESKRSCGQKEKRGTQNSKNAAVKVAPKKKSKSQPE